MARRTKAQIEEAKQKKLLEQEATWIESSLNLFEIIEDNMLNRKAPINEIEKFWNYATMRVDRCRFDWEDFKCDTYATNGLLEDIKHELNPHTHGNTDGWQNECERCWMESSISLLDLVERHMAERGATAEEITAFWQSTYKSVERKRVDFISKHISWC